MTYKITGSIKTQDRQSDYGMMSDYAISFESGETAQLSQKQTTPAPKVGDILEGTIEQTKYGPKFKKAQKDGFNGRQDPETRKEIIRQNSLTNAVTYMVAKANLMDKKEALKFLSGKSVLQTATYFAGYSNGKNTVVMTPEEIAKEFGYEEAKAITANEDEGDPDFQNDDPTDKEIEDKEIDEAVDTIPF